MADNVKLPAVEPTRLSVGASSSDTSITVAAVKDREDNTLTMTDFGAKGYGVIDPGVQGKEEHFVFTGISGTSISGVSTVIMKDPYTETSGLARSHSAGAIVILETNSPALLSTFANKSNDETVSGLWTFDSDNLPRVDDSATYPTAGAELASKAYVDYVGAGGTFSYDQTIVAGTAGATVAAGNLVYFDTTDNEWKLCDADTASTVDNVLLGIAQGAGTDGNAITGGVLIAGLDKNQSGMTIGDVMYASNTSGGLSSSAGTTEVTIGIARTATELYFSPRFDQNITEAQQDLLDAITANATEINQLDGATITASQLTEAGTFFGATDLSGAEAETLSDGSNADSLHTHGFDGLIRNSGLVEYTFDDKQDVLVGGTGGSNSFTAVTSRLSSGSTSGNEGILYVNGFRHTTGDFDWDQDHKIYFPGIQLGQLTQQDVFIGLGPSTSVVPSSATTTDRHVGFMIEDGTLYASRADGTTQDKSAAITGYTLTNWNTFFIDHDADGNTLFYVNGTLEATLSSNSPAGNTNYNFLTLGIATTENSDKTLQYATNIKVWVDLTS